MNKSKIIIGLISVMILIITINMVNATEYYTQGETVNLQFICTLDDAIPTTAEMNISLYNPKGKIVVTNNQTTAQGAGSFNYTFQFLNTGTYTVKMFCYNADYSYAEEDYYEITGIGNTKDKGISETAIFLVLALALSGFMWKYLSRFFGSFMMMILGLGVLFTIKENGWIGWIIFTIGFTSTIYAIITPKKKIRYK